MLKQSARDAIIGRRVAMIREHRLMSQAALGAAIGASKSVAIPGSPLI
jgi:DNA-binding XRE family transcriptional regulator